MMCLCNLLLPKQASTLSQLEILPILTMSTPTVKVALEIFPTNVAVELKMFAEKITLYYAKVCRGKQITEAEGDRIEACRHRAYFKEKCKGWLSEKTWLEIEKMFVYAGCHAANIRKSETCWRRGNRKGYENDANFAKREVEEHYQSVVMQKEISETLAANLRDMGWSAAWFAANTIFGHQEEAERDVANMDSHFNQIHGKITLAEILTRRPQIDNEDNAIFDDFEPFEILPIDVAEELKGYAEKSAGYRSKKYFGNRGEADVDKIEAKDHFHSFREKCKGLLSDRSCEDIRSMIKNAASYKANKTKGKKSWLSAEGKRYKATAAICEKKFHATYKAVVNRREISKPLATNLLELGRHAGQLATHTIVGRHDDAKRDQANLHSYFNKICGEINLVAMNFFMDDAKILSQTPKVVSEKDLVNNSDVDQAMTFGFSMTEGKTYSTSHTIGFSYGINSSFKAGFSGFGEINFELSFSFSRSHTFEQSVSTGANKSVEFPLSVPAHSAYVAKGMVSEAEMEIPYELVFDFGGARRKLRGHWKGVACSKATYQVDNKEHPSPTPTPVGENGSTSYCNVM